MSALAAAAGDSAARAVCPSASIATPITRAFVILFVFMVVSLLVFVRWCLFVRACSGVAAVLGLQSRGVTYEGTERSVFPAPAFGPTVSRWIRAICDERF